MGKKFTDVIKKVILMHFSKFQEAFNRLQSRLNAGAKLEIEQAIACLPPNSVILSFDEKVKGICDLFMARNVHTGKRHYSFYDWKNSFIVTEFLEKLFEIYPDMGIYIIWDGWSAHRSEHTKILAEHIEKELCSN